MKTYMRGREWDVSKSPVFPGTYVAGGEQVNIENCYGPGDKVGYRDDSFSGCGETDPAEVSYFETAEMGNVDIPEYLLAHYKLTDEEKEFLEDIVEGEPDEIDKEFFCDIIRAVVGGRERCLWLCDSPEDVYDSYFSYRMTREEYFKDGPVSWRIPKDAIILSDLGVEGKLYAY